MRYDGAKPQSSVVENFCTTGGQSLLSLPGIVEKYFSLNFKRYNPQSVRSTFAKRFGHVLVVV
jgi:hypothetical protein